MFDDPETQLVHFVERNHGQINVLTAQLFSTNAFSANTLSLNVLLTFTAIYLQSIGNTSNFITYFYQSKQISQK